MIPICIYALRQFTESLILNLAPSRKIDSGEISEIGIFLSLNILLFIKTITTKADLKMIDSDDTTQSKKIKSTKN